MSLRSIVVERIDIPADSAMISEVAAMEIRCGKQVRPSAYRFTFLASPVSDVQDVASLPTDSFLGNAVLLKNRIGSDRNVLAYIYESVFRWPALRVNKTTDRIPVWQQLPNHYVHVGRDFACEVAGHPYVIHGTFFRQQNAITGVCAHASLSIVLNNLKHVTAPITVEDINAPLGIDHITKKVGYYRTDASGDPAIERGLDIDQIICVAEKYGLKVATVDFVRHPDIDYAQYVYGIVESGYPCLLVFSTTDFSEAHVVTVLGHTLNRDKWLPEAQIAYEMQNTMCHSAVKWACHFIIHDDNFGSYLCMEPPSLRRITLPSYEERFRAVAAVGFLPRTAKVGHLETQWRAGLIAMECIEQSLKKLPQADSLEWLRRIHKELGAGNRLVARTLMVHSRDYKQHLEEVSDFYGEAYTSAHIASMTSGLRGYVWLTEMSLSDIYVTNQAKLIDVICGCSRRPVDLDDNLLLVRLPGVYGKATKRGFELFPTKDVKSHIPLFGLGTSSALQ